MSTVDIEKTLAPINLEKEDSGLKFEYLKTMSGHKV
jgi:hypothetical protein